MHQQTAIETIRQIAENVTDPELPILTLGDLGMVYEVTPADEADRYIVSIVPSFTACPATETILQDVKTALADAGLTNVDVQRVLSPAWSSDWISDNGHKKLHEAGIAPPQRKTPADKIPCPRCNSGDTILVSRFGSTLCKSAHKCQSCLEPFEAFKCH